MVENIKSQVIGGVKWTTASATFQATSSLLKLSFLARLLEKSDFGLMALVMFMLGFMELFMDMGLSTAILHKQNITKEEYGSLYWVNFIFSLLLYLIVLVLTSPMAAFYKEPELMELLPLMGLSLVLSAVGRQFKTIEQKNLNFRSIAYVLIIGSSLSLITAVILAKKGYGVYSLVYSSLIQHAFTNIVFLIIGLNKNGLALRIKLSETKPFLKIGMYHVGGQIINYFNRDLDILLIGKFYGAETLGGYSLAKQLIFRPAKIVNPILNRVGAPVLAKFQQDISQLRRNYLKLLNGVSSMIIPIYTTLIILAPQIVNLLYGSGFEDIVILVRILSIYMIFRSISNPLGSLIIATGRTNLGFIWSLVTLTIMPIPIIIGSQYSIEWVAINLTITMVLLFIPAWWFLARKMIDVKLSTYMYWTIPGIGLIKKS